ncbi:hypothetical protein QKW60_06105 [Defluviimonas aestuarii]|uniref:hypothetical protein n=1 Tax=Albidovulum aestuarii TaxID=1130726 RepID=UPI00249AA75D|nr:hypothetical protein [Defluviimonas aestuarii]MDI3335971.1 hypothetical protein [Defluviimonas aestuarii]
MDKGFPTSVKSFKKDFQKGKNFASKFFPPLSSANKPDFTPIAKDHELSAAFHQMIPATPDFQFKRLAADAKFDIPDTSPDHTATSDNAGGKNLVQPLPVGNAW